jgi:hypothetical protein
LRERSDQTRKEEKKNGKGQNQNKTAKHNSGVISRPRGNRHNEPDEGTIDEKTELCRGVISLFPLNWKSRSYDRK